MIQETQTLRKSPEQHEVNVKEPRLDCNSINLGNHAGCAVKWLNYRYYFLFFDTLCKEINEIQQEENKKKVSLSKLVYLVHEMSTERKKEKEEEKRRASQQHTAATVCSHYRLGDNTRTFCFALPAFLFYPKGWRWVGGKQSTSEVNRTLVCSQWRQSDLRGRTSMWVREGFGERVQGDMEIWIFALTNFFLAVV